MIRSILSFLMFSILICSVLGQDCATSAGAVTGSFEDSNIDEASGLAASRTQTSPQILWTHNDHGDSPRIFAAYQSGETAATVNLRGVNPDDFEDIAIGSGPVQGVDYIYAGDIGNNDNDKTEYRIYRFVEPNVTGLLDAVIDIPVEEITTITVTSRLLQPTPDFETLMHDPDSGLIYMIEKNRDEARAKVYSFVPPETSNLEPITMDLHGEMPIYKLAAGDITPDGSKILLREDKGADAYMYTRFAGESVEAALVGTAERPPIYCYLRLADAGDANSEAIAAAADSNGFYTTTEGNQQPIYYYEIL